MSPVKRRAPACVWAVVLLVAGCEPDTRAVDQAYNEGVARGREEAAYRYALAWRHPGGPVPLVEIDPCDTTIFWADTTTARWLRNLKGGCDWESESRRGEQGRGKR